MKLLFPTVSCGSLTDPPLLCTSRRAYVYHVWIRNTGSGNGAGENELVFQFTCLQPHLYIKIHEPHIHINTRK